MSQQTASRVQAKLGEITLYWLTSPGKICHYCGETEIQIQTDFFIGTYKIPYSALHCISRKCSEKAEAEGKRIAEICYSFFVSCVREAA